MRAADKADVIKHLKVAQEKYRLQYTGWVFGPDIAGEQEPEHVARGKAKQAAQEADYYEVTALLKKLES